MTVEVFAADEQSAHPVDTLRWVRLARAVLEAEGTKGEAELSLLFVDEQAMSDLNKRFAGKDGPTDVLAFPIDEEPAEGGRSPDSGGSGPGWVPVEPSELPSLLGDVVICPSVALRNATESDPATGFDDEVALLVVHGILHLMGMDHVDDEEAKVMEGREQELLARFHRAPPGRPREATMTTSQVLMLAAIGALVMLAGFFAMSETSLTRISRIKAMTMEEEGRRGAPKLARLVEHPERFLNPVLLLVLVCHLIVATLVGVLAEDLFGALGVAVAVFFEVVVIFVLAESAPKTWAVQHPERAALLTAPLVSLITNLAPIRLLARGLIGLSNLILPGKGLKQGPFVSEEELLATIDVATEDEVIEHDERRLIHSIIEFGDTVVREVMVPRPDMVVVEGKARVSDVLEVAIAAGYSRLPAFDQGIDDVVGIVFLKDLVRADREGKGDDEVRDLAREAHFVPETKRVTELLKEMQLHKFHIAVVVDEYGGTAGLATLEDLIEELVGEIVDEFDVEEPPVERLGNGEVRVNARMPIDEVNELLQADLPTGDWDSVGGLVFNLLGHVPTEGEVVEVDGHCLIAEKVQGRRIGRVRITKAESPASASAE